MSNQEKFVAQRAGDDPYATKEEILEIERKKREMRMASFLKANPDFKAKVISDFEFSVREKLAKIVQGKSSIAFTMELLNPVRSAVTKLEAHGPLKGALPALLYGVLTPIIRGLPNAVIGAPRDYYTIQKNISELRALSQDYALDGYDWSHLDDEYKKVLDEIVGLQDRVKQYELDEKYTQ